MDASWRAPPFLLLLLVPFSQSLLCYECNSNTTEEQCSGTCEGDLCGVWKWAKSEEERFIRQGCLSGMDSVKIGCRTNHMGASLCICNDSALCNTEHRSESTHPTLPVVRLPFVHCKSVVHLHSQETMKSTNSETKELRDSEEEDDLPLRIEPQRIGCRSNYCLFTKRETVADEGQTKPFPSPSDLSVSLCAPNPEREFDLRLWEGRDLLRGLPSNFCYRQRTQKNKADTTCICSTNDCNANPRLGGDGAIQCYMAEVLKKQEDVDTYSLCHGDFCFIRKMPEAAIGYQAPETQK